MDYNYLLWALQGLNNSDTQMKADGLHFPDTYKLPNHPSFSNESIYSLYGPSKTLAGQWQDVPSSNGFQGAFYNPSFRGFLNGKMPQFESWYDPQLGQR